MNRSLRLLTLFGLLGVEAGFVHATTLDIELNTSSLMNAMAGPFYLDFQLINGNSATNTVALTNFTFGGGAAFGTPTISGDVMGSLASGILLGDTQFRNELFQSFIPGSRLSFRAAFTTSFSGGTPDAFSFAILDANLIEIPTLGPGDALVFADLTPSAAVRLYATDPARTSLVLAPALIVPEPAAWTFALAGLAVLTAGGAFLSPSRKAR